MNVVAVAVVAVTVLAFLYVRSYNRLVNGREVVDDAWASLSTELDLRHELVPQLAEAVMAGPVEEPRLIDDLLGALRAAGEAAPDADARRGPEHDLARVAAAVVDLRRQYPVLDSAPSFNDVRRELAINDDRVGDAARYYDERAADLGRRMRSFPSSFVARRHGIEPAAPFAT